MHHGLMPWLLHANGAMVDMGKRATNRGRRLAVLPFQRHVPPLHKGLSELAGVPCHMPRGAPAVKTVATWHTPHAAKCQVDSHAN
eukprot:COSAG02_NODE_529_length_20702_cov_43.720555_3_plen_85_part_00